MKPIVGLVLGCAILIGFAASAGEGKDSKPGIRKPKRKAAATKTEAPAKRTAEITGSRIPCKVDESGRPVDSTLNVIVIDQKTIAFYNLGDPASAIARLPMARVGGR